MKYIKHLKTITKHKLYVMKFCFKCGQYKRGLLHDLSKFGPTEFFSSAKYYTGTSSPIDAEKKEKGYSLAWQHHKGRNPHHWEYWIDNLGTYANTPCEIPYNYMIEMLCDWLAAGIVYSKVKPDYNKGYSGPFDYYTKGRKYYILHPRTKRLVEGFLWIIKEYGINEFCRVAKSLKEKEIYEISNKF